jgi:hypothetical protein
MRGPCRDVIKRKIGKRVQNCKGISEEKTLEGAVESHRAKK